MSTEPSSPHASGGTADETTMGFLDHLDELRARLIRSLIAVGGGMAIAFFFVEEIERFVLGPVQRAMPPGAELAAQGLTEGFAFSVDLAFLGGMILAAPFVTYQVWRFIAPGLYAREKRLAVPLVLMATAGALAGAAFSHYVLFPSSVDFLARWLPTNVRMLPGLTNTFGLYKSMLLAMVAVFQLPAVVFLLARLRAVTAAWLWRRLGYAVFVIVVAAALITPTGDAWNQLFAAVPMLAMYLVSIVVAWLARPRHSDDGLNDDWSALALLVGATLVHARRWWGDTEPRRLQSS